MWDGDDGAVTVKEIRLIDPTKRIGCERGIQRITVHPIPTRILRIPVKRIVRHQPLVQAVERTRVVGICPIRQLHRIVHLIPVGVFF